MEALLAQLQTSKDASAAAYLIARQNGTEIAPGKAAGVEDARAWARGNLGERGIPDAEVIRYRLDFLLGRSRAERE